MQELVEMCRHELDTRVDKVLSINVCRVPIITNYSQEYALITAATLVGDEYKSTEKYHIAAGYKTTVESTQQQVFVH